MGGVKRVLVNAPMDEQELARLGQAHRIVAVDQGDIRDRILSYMPFEAIIASAVLPLQASLLGILPGLQVIGRLGTGVDNVDLQAATERGILVVHTPQAPTQSTAEHTVALLYALAKDLLMQDRGLRAGRWSVRHERIGRDLAALTLGLVGLGKIGRRVAELLRPLQMRILAHDPYVEVAAAAACGVELVSELEQLLPQVDVLSLHLPLDQGTRHLIDRRALARMKPAAWLINTSRGGVVHEPDLLQALRQGTIAGAALDVFDPEPPRSDNPLLRMDNVIVSPHRAFYTQEGLRRLSREVVDQVLKGLRGELPDFLANPSAWEHALCREGEI